MIGIDKYNITLNKSGVFILPMVGIELKYLNALINTYLKDSEAEFKTNLKEIYLVFDKDTLTISDSEYLSQKSNILDFRINQNNTVILKFNINETFKNDIIKVIKGDYSKLSEVTKSVVLNFWIENKATEELLKTTNVYKILYPSKELLANKARLLGVPVSQLKGELVSKPLILEETYFSSDTFNLVWD